jgi:hypothetical protein
VLSQGNRRFESCSLRHKNKQPYGLLIFILERGFETAVLLLSQSRRVSAKGEAKSMKDTDRVLAEDRACIVVTWRV